MLQALLVEDDWALRQALLWSFEGSGVELVLCATGAEALARFDASVSVAVVDLGLPDMSGWQVIEKMHAMRPDCPLIVATAWDRAHEDKRCRFLRRLFIKPFFAEELIAFLKEVR